MPILCMRHGHADAASSGASDEERPLSNRGRAQAREVGEGLRKTGIRVARVVSSPLLRARETAEVVAHSLGFTGPLELQPGLSYAAAPASPCAFLEQAAPEGVLAVGHMPTLPQTIYLLSGRQLGALATAQVVCVEDGKARWTLAPGDATPRKL